MLLAGRFYIHGGARSPLHPPCGPGNFLHSRVRFRASSAPKPRCSLFVTDANPFISKVPGNPILADERLGGRAFGLTRQTIFSGWRGGSAKGKCPPSHRGKCSRGINTGEPKCPNRIISFYYLAPNVGDGP